MTDAVHGQPPHDGDDDAYESHWYRVMRSIAHHDTDAEGEAAQEADDARGDRARGDDGPQVIVTVAGDPSEADAQR